MHSRSEIAIVRRRHEKWLVRRFYPRLNADMEMCEDFILCLRGDEENFRSGRFLHFSSDHLQHSVQVWYDHDDEDKLIHDFADAISWIRATGAPWSFEFNAVERLGVSFSFDDITTAFMFMIEFGGSQI